MLAHDLALGDTARVETEMEMLEIITDSLTSRSSPATGCMR